MKRFLPSLFLCAALLAAADNVQDFHFGKVEEQANPEVYLDWGAVAVRDGLLEIAERHYEKYIESVRPHEPGFARGVVQYALVCLKQDKLDKAEEALKDHAETARGDVPRDLQDQLLLLQAQIDFRKDNQDALLQNTARLLAQEETSLDIRREAVKLASDVYAKRKQWQLQWETLQEYNRSHPEEINDIEILRRTIQACSATNRLQEAEAILAEHTAQLTGADALAGKLLRIQNFAQIHKFEEAGRLFQEVRPSLPNHPDQEWWFTLNLYADESFAAKRLDEALGLYALAETIAPDNDALRTLLAQRTRIFLAKGAAREAREARERLGEKFRDSTEYLDLTDALARLCRKEEKRLAAELFLEITTLKAASPQRRYDAMMNCAECHFEHGELEKAREVFQEAKKLGLNDDQKVRALLRAAQANAALFKNTNITVEAGKTIALYQEIRQEFPAAADTGEATFQMALLHMELKHYSEAADTFADFLKHFPNNPKRDEAELQRCIALRRGSDDRAILLAVADALQQLAEAAKSPEIRLQAPLEAFLAAAKADDFRRADALLTAIVEDKNARKREEALFQRALLRFVHQETKGAREDAQLFFQEFPASPLTAELRIHTADSYAAEENWADALPHYRAAIQSAEEQPLLKTRAIYECAWCESRLGHPENALDILETMPAFKTPEEITSPAIRGIVARACYLKGDILARRSAKPDEFSEAASAYGKAARNAQEKNLSLSALGRQGEMLFAKAKAFGVQENSGKEETLQEAKGIFERLRSEEPPARYRIRAAYGLAQTLLEQKETESAKDILSDICSEWKAITAPDAKRALEPIVAHALFDLAGIYQAAGDSQSLQEAIHCYRNIEDNNLPMKDTAKSKIEELREKHPELAKQLD